MAFLGPAAALAAAAAAGAGMGMSLRGSKRRHDGWPSEGSVITPVPGPKAARTVYAPTPGGPPSVEGTYLPPNTYWRVNPPGSASSSSSSAGSDDGKGGDESRASGSSSSASAAGGQVHSDRVFSSAGAAFGGEGISKPVDPCSGPVALIRQYERCTKPLRFIHTNYSGVNDSIRPCYITSTTAHSAGIVPMSNIPAGTDIENRTGRSVNFERLVLRGIVRAPTFPEGAVGANQMYFPACVVRITLIYDRQSNSNLPLQGDIFQHASANFTEMNMANSDRFLVLCDRSYSLKGLWRPDANALTTCEQDCSSVFIDLDLYGLSATYNGNAASIPVTGSLFLVARSDVPISGFPFPETEKARLPVFTFSFTTYFRD